MNTNRYEEAVTRNLDHARRSGKYKGEKLTVIQTKIGIRKK